MFSGYSNICMSTLFKSYAFMYRWCLLIILIAMQFGFDFLQCFAFSFRHHSQDKNKSYH